MERVEKTLKLSANELVSANSSTKIDFVIEGIYSTSYLETSNEKYFENKETAVAAAEFIIESMPQFENETEKAYYLYDYLASNVTYVEGSATQNYIADALVLRKSNCDGIAKSLTLLFNLAGIECFNVHYIEVETVIYNLCLEYDLPLDIAFGPDKRFNERYSSLPDRQQICEILYEDVKSKCGVDLKETVYYQKDTGTWNLVGHTWNIAKLDGDYHYFDATNETSIKKLESKMEPFPCYFALSTELMSTEVDVVIRPYIPNCNMLEDGNPFYCYVESLTTEDAVQKIADSLIRNDSFGKPYVNVITQMPVSAKDVVELGLEINVRELGLKLEKLTGFELKIFHDIGSNTQRVQYQIKKEEI